MPKSAKPARFKRYPRPTQKRVLPTRKGAPKASKGCLVWWIPKVKLVSWCKDGKTAFKVNRPKLGIALGTMKTAFRASRVGIPLNRYVKTSRNAAVCKGVNAV